MKIPKWSELTTREKWFAGTALLFATLFIGSMISRVFANVHLDWEAISALVAVVALPLAFVGYMDNKNAQRLEHRPYIRLQVQEIVTEPDQPITFDVAPVNYGRTPAHKLHLRGNVVYCAAATDFDNLTDDFDISKPGRISVHPGEEVAFMHCPSTLVLTEEQLNRIPSSMTILIRISCVYTDDFGGSYETRSTSYIARVREGQFGMTHVPMLSWAN